MYNTNQQVFDKVVVHLLTQKKQSKKGTGYGEVCAYRGKDNTSCAVGCLIPEWLYSGKIEGRTIHSQSFDFIWDSLFSPSVNKDFVAGLQNIHDRCDPESWKDKLVLEAVTNGLTFPEVESA